MRPLIACLLIVPLMIGGCDRRSGQGGQANASAPTLDYGAAQNAAASGSGEVRAGDASALAPGTVDRSHKGMAEPAAGFTAPGGRTVTLAAFRGRPLLLNLWATWCAPCVAELPALDGLAGRLGQKVQVVAVSQDLDGAAKVVPFLTAHHVANLKPYLDPDLSLSLAYQANLPTTILYDSTGHEVWRIAGGYDWNTPAAAALVAEAH